MDDGVNTEETKSLKMGASSNPNSAKIATLQERKKQIEEKLAKHNQELRELCIKEAELTGSMPIEYPLEPGETTPSFRRRIGTAFQLPQNLINNNSKEQEINDIELEMQIFAKMAEAALGLANENNGNKTVRRKHMAEYQQHKLKYSELEEKMQFLKTHIQKPQFKLPSPNNQPKQKKKPRPLDQDTDTVSMSIENPFGKTVLRHSLRSLQHPVVMETNDLRYSVQSHPKLIYKGSDSSSLNENMAHYIRHDDALSGGLHRLSLNGFKNYVDESPNDHQYNIHTQSSNNLYKQHTPQYINPSHTLPHAARRSPQSQSFTNQYQQDLLKYNNNHLHRQTSPSTSSSSSVKFYPIQVQQPNYRQYDPRTINPHQLQPHQQYEHDCMSSGLGGYWKRTENGEMFWCNSSTSEVGPKDKRFGSLDRRKNKHIQRRNSPNVETKSATLASAPPSHEHRKPQQIVGRHRQNNRQLVRTQSLGSVGGQTIDSVCPSDDNSSCGSESLSYSEHSNNIRKQKQKEWYETSLDGPVNVTPTRSHSTVPSIAPEDKYMEFSSSIPSPSPHILAQSPQTPKPLLEIPAETNPSPRPLETNLEIFNNNIPKNGTVVQHAQWKPYHEETKPFEMADFYKYSTKYNKSPQKAPQEESHRTRSHSIGFRNLPSPQSTQSNETFDDDNSIQKGIYQPLQPMKCQPFSPVNNSNISIGSPMAMNTSLDLSQLTPNVAENFSAEMNAWYQNHEHQVDNNNATLV